MSIYITLVYKNNEGYIFRCGCGWTNEPKFTLEAAGREIDLHLAEKFPSANVRFPCCTDPHLVEFEYDPTPLEPGEGHVYPRMPGQSPKDK